MCIYDVGGAYSVVCAGRGASNTPRIYRPRCTHRTPNGSPTTDASRSPLATAPVLVLPQVAQNVVRLAVEVPVRARLHSRRKRAHALAAAHAPRTSVAAMPSAAMALGTARTRTGHACSRTRAGCEAGPAQRARSQTAGFARERQIDRRTERQANRQTDRRQTDRQTGRQADRQAGRQTDRQNNSQEGTQAARQQGSKAHLAEG